MVKAYLEFTDLFSRLSPYELNHFSEVLLCKLESGFESTLFSQNKIALTEKDIKYAMTETMRDIAVELREQEIAHDHAKLNQAKALMFSVKRIA